MVTLFPIDRNRSHLRYTYEPDSHGWPLVRYPKPNLGSLSEACSREGPYPYLRYTYSEAGCSPSVLSLKY